MRSEEEIVEMLRKCREVSGFGMSNGICPLKEAEGKTCEADCHWDHQGDQDPLSAEELKEYKKDCCENWGRGCCAECSFPSAIEWVLGEGGNGTDNGQKRLIKAMKGS